MNDETPGARSARLLEESLAQDTANTALAQAALTLLMMLQELEGR